MHRQTGTFLLMILLVIGMSVCFTARADIPAKVKDSYQYNQSDDSIIIVKERMRELGYFSKSAKFTGSVNITLRDAVIQFQEQNGMDPDGEINKAFLELLFSDDAVEKGGRPKEKEKPEAETEAPVTETADIPREPETGIQEIPAQPAAEEETRVPDTGIVAEIDKIRTMGRENTNFFLYIFIAIASLFAVSLLIITILHRRKKRGSKRINLARRKGIVKNFPAQNRVLPDQPSADTGTGSPAANSSKPVKDKSKDGKTGIRIRHPHYITNMEYECSECGARFTLAYRSCPECKALFTKSGTDNREYEDEVRKEKYWDHQQRGV